MQAGGAKAWAARHIGVVTAALALAAAPGAEAHTFALADAVVVANSRVAGRLNAVVTGSGGSWGRQGGHGAEGGKIAPDLDPASDKEFYVGHTADYPTDGRLDVKHHFSYPYPAVQAHSVYDSDYTSDENADNGEWAAQMEYDRLRAELDKTKQRKARTHQAEATEKEELDQATRDKQAADAVVQADEAKVSDAKARVERENAAADATKTNNTALSLAEARALVAKQTKVFENCKKELDDAKARLAALEAKQNGTDETAAIEAAKKDAERAVEAAETKAAADKKADAAVQAKMAEEKKEHDHAMKSYENDLKKEKELNAALERARAKVARLRGETPQGADAHSGAHPVLLGLALGLAGARVVL